MEGEMIMQGLFVSPIMVGGLGFAAFPGDYTTTEMPVPTMPAHKQFNIISRGRSW